MWPNRVAMARIVYIHHNCFFLLTDRQALLFDYPSPSFLPDAAAAAAASVMAGASLTVFVSHAHEDHFNPDIVAATRQAASCHFVVSDDVADLYADVLPPQTLVMAPKDQQILEGLTLEAMESNDQGVAYRITTQEGLSVYYGGDLALWNWPGQSPIAARAVGMSWRRALAQIKKRPVDVAFSNMDPRLPSLAGAPDFVAAIAPRVFVPMHLDGHTHYIDRYADRLAGPATTLFRYATPGDSLDVPSRNPAHPTDG